MALSKTTTLTSSSASSAAMTSWNCLTISGPMTLMGGLSTVTRQYAGDRRATRICASFVGGFICMTLAGTLIVAMGFFSVFVGLGNRLTHDNRLSAFSQNAMGSRNWTMVLPALLCRVQWLQCLRPATPCTEDDPQ